MNYFLGKIVHSSTIEAGGRRLGPIPHANEKGLPESMLPVIERVSGLYREGLYGPPFMGGYLDGLYATLI
jgi:hypothetical protein